MPDDVNEANDQQGEQAEQLTPEQAEFNHNAAALQVAVDTGQFTLPEHFDSAEAYLKSVVDTKSHSTKLSQENADLRKAAEQTTETKTEPVTDLAAALSPKKSDAETSKGIDWSKVTDELTQNNSLSDETKKLIADSGLPKDYVDRIEAGHQNRIKSDAKEAADLRDEYP